MAVPTLITDLSETIASNSPGGSDLIGGSLDNYIRALAGILRQESLNKAWLPYGEAVTYVSATTFTVVEATAGGTRWYAGRPFKAVVTAGTIYGVIASTSVSGPTRTVTVLSDTALDSGLSRVDLAVEPRSVLPVQKNAIINPMFRFWQRNTTFSIAASGTPTKTADGWTAISGSATGASTVSQQAHALGQASIPFEPTYYLRWDQTVGSTGTAPYIKQHVEGVRSFAGRTVCLTILCKLQSAGTLTTLTPTLTQNFGTGGSPSSAVNTSGTAFLPTSSWAFYHFAIQVPSISGKTIGTTVDTDSLVAVFTASPAGATFTVDIAGVWLHDAAPDPGRRIRPSPAPLFQNLHHRPGAGAEHRRCELGHHLPSDPGRCCVVARDGLPARPAALRAAGESDLYLLQHERGHQRLVQRDRRCGLGCICRGRQLHRAQLRAGLQRASRGG
jgi:hypothetical protein